MEAETKGHRQTQTNLRYVSQPLVLVLHQSFDGLTHCLGLCRARAARKKMTTLKKKKKEEAQNTALAQHNTDTCQHTTLVRTAQTDVNKQHQK